MPVNNALILSLLTATATKSVEARVARARDGDSREREDLIRDYTPFILKTASTTAGRYLTVGRDDEVSVALLAFDEAINAYSSPRPGFLAFAATVIRRRLIDYYRKENRRDEVPFSSVTPSEDSEDWPVDAQASRTYDLDGWSKVLERRDDIERWQEALKPYRLSLKDVAKAAPKHRDARQRAMSIGNIIGTHRSLRDKFLREKRLPIPDILDILPDDLRVSKKTLERQKAYIMAIALIVAHNLGSLREFLEL
jgi:RNA polymerase sigma factor